MECTSMRACEGVCQAVIYAKRTYDMPQSACCELSCTGARESTAAALKITMFCKKKFYNKS